MEVGGRKCQRRFTEGLKNAAKNAFFGSFLMPIIWRNAPVEGFLYGMCFPSERKVFAEVIDMETESLYNSY